MMPENPVSSTGAPVYFAAPVLLFALSVFAFGLQGFIFGRLIEELQPVAASVSMNGLIVAANAAALTIAGAAMLWKRSATISALAVALIFSASFAGLHMPVVIRAEFALTNFVAPLECLVIMSAAVTSVYGRMQPVAQRVAALMLLLFGVIHLTEQSFIASLIPGWIPLAKLWPWLTGSLMIFGGIAMTIGKVHRLAAIAIAAMFLAWVPLVHVPRLITAPGSAFEWSFATTALILAAALVIVTEKRSVE